MRPAGINILAVAVATTLAPPPTRVIVGWLVYPEPGLTIVTAVTTPDPLTVATAVAEVWGLPPAMTTVGAEV